MLQAQSSAARDLSYHQAPAEPLRPMKTRRNKSRTNHKRKLYIKAALALFAYSMILVALCIKSAAMGYEIGRLEQDTRGMATDNQRLEYQIAQKSSLAYVEQAAISQLGMYRPDAGSSITMAVQAEPVSIAANTQAQADNASISQRLLNNLYASLSRLAANN